MNGSGFGGGVGGGQGLGQGGGLGLGGHGLGHGGGGGGTYFLAENSQVTSFIVSRREPTSTHLGVVVPFGT